MNIKEMFTQLQTDGDIVIARFGGNRALLERFVKKFPEDNSYGWLKESVEKSDFEEMQRAAHTLKGVAMNLGFSALGEQCGAMVNALRQSRTDVLAELFDKITASYNEITGLIKELQ